MRSKFSIKLIAVLVMLSFSSFLFGADVDNRTVTVTQQTGIDLVQFEVTLIHTGAAEDDVASQYIDLAFLDLEGATIQAISLVGGTRDVNIDIEGSNSKLDSTFEQWETRKEFDDFSPDNGNDEKTAILDRAFIKTDTLTAATLAAKLADLADYQSITDSFFQISNDTAGSPKYITYIEKDRALRCRYIRVVSDGQSGNEATVSTKVILTFRKKANAPPQYDFRLAKGNTTSS